MPTRTKSTNLFRPGFVVDPESVGRTSGRQIDWANVADSYRIGAVVVTTTATAAQNATTVAVAALTGAIPSGTTIYLGGTKTITLTADAAKGATSLTASALPTALGNGDTGTYAGTGPKFLPAGTVVGEALSGNGRVSPRVVTTNPAVYIMETNATQYSDTDSLSGYGMLDAGRFYENLLPDATGGPPKTLASAIKTELGVRFRFETYGDSTS